MFWTRIALLCKEGKKRRAAAPHRQMVFFSCWCEEQKLGLSVLKPASSFCITVPTNESIVQNYEVRSKWTEQQISAV
jgi:hypothetical protein